MRSTISIAISALCLTSLSLPALSQQRYKLADNEQQTQYSGRSTSPEVLRGSDGAYRALYEIEIAEKSDTPCYLRARSRHLNTLRTSAHVYEGSTHVDTCEPSDRSRRVLSFSNTDTYIRGLQICTNNSGNRLKGLRIFGARLNRQTGALTNVPGNQEFTRARCQDWGTAVYCPVGRVATKVAIGQQLNFDFDALANIDGLALVCRRVVAQ